MTESNHVWNSEPEVGETLAALIKLTRAKTVLEIGVFQGQTSKAMIEALPESGQFIGIDIEDLRLEENKADWKNKRKSIDFVKGDSHKVLKSLPRYHFDLIFVDAAHHWEHILPEFKLVEHLVSLGGIVVYHDAMHIQDVSNLMKYASHYNWGVSVMKTPELRGLAILSRKW
jgi:O-methyltransferase